VYPVSSSSRFYSLSLHDALPIFEPLMGMNPRDKKENGSIIEFISVRLVIITIFLSFIGLVAEFVAEMDINFAVWKPGFMDQFGDGFIWLPISIAIIVAIAVIMISVKLASKTKKTKKDDEKCSA